MPRIKTSFPKPAMTAGDWELYTATKPKAEVDRAARKMNTALWRSLRQMERDLLRLPELCRVNVNRTIAAAYDAHIERTMEEFRHLGAWDSEPRGHAIRVMQEGAERLVGGLSFLP